MWPPSSRTVTRRSRFSIVAARRPWNMDVTVMAGIMPGEQPTRSAGHRRAVVLHTATARSHLDARVRLIHSPRRYFHSNSARRPGPAVTRPVHFAPRYTFASALCPCRAGKRAGKVLSPRLQSRMLDRAHLRAALDATGGLLRLEPAWVPRTFMHPGRRLRLHPDDLYALGAHRGGINERWFSSTTNADNGPGTPPDEGLSYVRLENGTRVTLKEAVGIAGDLLIGSTVMEREGGWNVLCK